MKNIYLFIITLLLPYTAISAPKVPASQVTLNTQNLSVAVSSNLQTSIQLIDSNATNLEARIIDIESNSNLYIVDNRNYSILTMSGVSALIDTNNIIVSGSIGNTKFLGTYVYFGDIGGAVAWYKGSGDTLCRIKWNTITWYMEENVGSWNAGYQASNLTGAWSVVFSSGPAPTNVNYLTTNVPVTAKLDLWNGSNDMTMVYDSSTTNWKGKTSAQITNSQMNVSGPIYASANTLVYFGATNSINSWRIGPIGTNFEIQVYTINGWERATHFIKP